jgi:hypothetical protein
MEFRSLQGDAADAVALNLAFYSFLQPNNGSRSTLLRCWRCCKVSTGERVGWMESRLFFGELMARSEHRTSPKMDIYNLDLRTARAFAFLAEL